MEAVADDFAGVGNGDEGGRFVHTDEVAQFDCLRAAHNGDDHGFLFFFVLLVFQKNENLYKLFHATQNLFFQPAYLHLTNS